MRRAGRIPERLMPLCSRRISVTDGTRRRIALMVWMPLPCCKNSLNAASTPFALAGAGLLTGALAQALGVQDEYRTGRDLQPPPGGEVRQCLVDRLSRGPDQLSQLLLGQVVMDVQPVALLLAEPGGQVEQVLRHPPRDVGEHQVRG